VTGADVLQHQQIATQRADVSNFGKPTGPELILDREVVLVIHLILAIRIVEEDETAARRRRKAGARRSHRKRRGRHTAIERIASNEERRAATRVRDRSTGVTARAGARI